MESDGKQEVGAPEMCCLPWKRQRSPEPLCQAGSESNLVYQGAVSWWGQ